MTSLQTITKLNIIVGDFIEAKTDKDPHTLIEVTEITTTGTIYGIDHDGDEISVKGFEVYYNHQQEK